MSKQYTPREMKAVLVEKRELLREWESIRDNASSINQVLFAQNKLAHLKSDIYGIEHALGIKD